MDYQENRTKRIEIFEDTIQYCERNTRLLESIKQTRQNTLLYRKPLKECSEAHKTYEQPVNISVSTKRTLETAKQLHLRYKDKRIGILNFASASNPGGDVIRGNNAHEEILCRCSTLYPCLNTIDLHQKYYDFHKQQRNQLYTDTCIITPGITVFKTTGQWPQMCQESEWFSIDVISCSAPDLRKKDAAFNKYIYEDDTLIIYGKIRKLLQHRIKGMLQAAVICNIDILVLEAFGCCTFFNSPYMVAEMYKEILKEFTYSFQKIEFSVFCTPTKRENYEIFSSILG